MRYGSISLLILCSCINFRADLLNYSLILKPRCTLLKTTYHTTTRYSECHLFPQENPGASLTDSNLATHGTLPLGIFSCSQGRPWPRQGHVSRAPSQKIYPSCYYTTNTSAGVHQCLTPLQAPPPAPRRNSPPAGDPQTFTSFENPV